MRSALPVLVLLSISLATAVRADGPAAVTAVTLHPGGATITRSVPVAAGAARAVVTGIGDNFDPDTLRVESDPGIRVGRIDVRDVGRTESADPAQAALEEKIQSLRDEQEAIDAEIAAGDVVKGYLERLGQPGGGGGDSVRAPIDPKALAGVIETLSHSARETLEHRQQLGVKRRELRKRTEALQRDLARMHSGARDSRTITMGLEATRAGTLRLSYQVASAGWQPAYRAALDSAASRVDLVRMARIAQKTGEDWKDVKLRLSTSVARRSTSAEEPDPWLLRYSIPVPQQERMRAKRDAMGALEADKAEPPVPVYAAATVTALAPAKAAPAPAFAPPTFETEGTFETEFEVPGLVSLPSDGRLVSIDLAQQPIAVKQRVQVAPRISTEGILTARAERPEGVWPAGDLQILRDGSFVGQGPWNPQGAETFELSFGRDDLVQVRVDREKGDSATTGLLSRRNQRTIADGYTLLNRHPTPIDVLVLEASPVATSDEITVEAAFEPRPTTENWQKRRGVVAWEKTLAPRESARILVRYTVSWPREGVVPGLE